MKPSIPKGTRDFSPVEMQRRNFIFNTIRTVYEKFGYEQIETPTMENLSTLEGKYGEEGDKLLYRIIDSGNPFQKTKEQNGNDKISEFDFRVSDYCEKGLRYDLTVPFARYVVMHQNELTFPFKRYQIQPVWRADRPQKGRYREFYQCDADVIGSTSLLNEVELIQIIDEVFSKLGIKIEIKLNNRKILAGLAENFGGSEKLIDLTVAIDKIDKVGIEGVKEELRLKEFSENSIVRLVQLLNNKEDSKQMLKILDNYLIFSEIGKKGLEEIREVFDLLTNFKFYSANLNFDVSLARGLNYYTGAIIEVKVDDPRSTFTSSVLGGGRYDDLTGIFGLPNVSGVGISFGVDRIYDVMDEMKLFEQMNLQLSSTKILFVNFGAEEEKHCLQLVTKVRAAGINAELYPDQAKMKKQMSYADSKKIPFVAIIGSEEIKEQKIMLKNMVSGDQEKISLEELIKKIK